MQLEDLILCGNWTWTSEGNKGYQKGSLIWTRCTEIDKEGVKPLMKEINGLKHLQSLTLEFPRYMIWNQKEFLIFLCSCHNIMDEELETISNGLFGMEKLEDIDMSFA